LLAGLHKYRFSQNLVEMWHMGHGRNH